MYACVHVNMFYPIRVYVRMQCNATYTNVAEEGKGDKYSEDGESECQSRLRCKKRIAAVNQNPKARVSIKESTI